MAVFNDGRQEVADYAAAAGFHFDGDRHPGCKVHQPVIDLHGLGVERNASRKCQILRFGGVLVLRVGGLLL